jgi:hypothetical protein
MDEKVLRMAVQEVLDELGMKDRRFELETAMAAPNSESFQIRLLDESGDGRAVVVNLKDKNGEPTLYLDEIKDRVREQLETFADITGEND